MIMPADSKPKKSILIVDNNVHETDILHDWFRRNGFHVEAVTSSLDAVSRVRNSNYNFVFIDMDLEGELGGFETIWLMKTIVNGSRIILLSKNPTHENKQRALSYGVFHWIHKPLNKTNTIREIKQLFETYDIGPTQSTWQTLKTFVGSKVNSVVRR